MNRSLPPNSGVIPVLIYDDVPEAIAWLCGAFGFRERLHAGKDHAQLLVGDGNGAVFLGASRRGYTEGAPDQAEYRVPGTFEVNSYVHVRVADVDAHFEHAKQFGVSIISEPTTYPYGDRQYTVADLGRHRWTFSQTVEDVDPQSWGAVASEYLG